MGRWTYENVYDQHVHAAVDALPWAQLSKEQAVALIKGVIASESAFDPRALRGEPQLGDASVGLMQLLYSTAKGLGYPGTKPIDADREHLTGLYSPRMNIMLGATRLSQLVQWAGGDIKRAISAYNGGDRPGLGLGTRATKAGRICLQWKPNAPQTGRTIERDCARSYSYKAGEFGNQPYVDKVTHNFDYFFASAAGSPPQAVTK
jgi:soluble lytic murein transglycosylase-like protein